MAGGLADGLTVANPAHSLWVRVHRIERIKVFSDPATAKKASCVEERWSHCRPV
jgi:hypothetical protein